MVGLLTKEDRRWALLLEHCYDCRHANSVGEPRPVIESDHADCHGWYHCDCCGGCEACYANSEVDIGLYEWEQALTPGAPG